MKIVAISDTHNRHKYLTAENRLPSGDLLIHAGDLTSLGHKHEVEDVFKWFKEIESNYTYGIVFIAGNHDKSFDGKFEWLEELLTDLQSTGRIHYLENSSVSINNINIWGSPITPWFHGDRWAFNKHRGDSIKEIWDTIPYHTDIIVTHGPVAYKLDHTFYDKLYVGCEDLRFAVEQIKPKAFICGHIHEGYGIVTDENTTYINASICTLRYDPNNNPIVFNLNDKVTVEY